MIGTILNVAGILAGGGIGLVRRRSLSRPQEAYFKVVLGAFTVFYGLRLTWLSLNGTPLLILKQVVIAIAALALGRLAGRALRFQRMSNHLGRSAREQIAAAREDDPRRLNAGFKTCAAVFCAAPLGLLGAVQDGLSAYAYPLAMKAVMDGLATMGFVGVFGWGVLLAAIPVLALQGTITLMCARFLEPFLAHHSLLDSVNAVGGLLVFSVALVILEVKRIQLADYLPSLVAAPLLTWIWH
jgi:uncharacterized protein